MRLLHVADIHLGASYAAFGAMAEERSAQVLETFRALPLTALENRADAVLIAGDLFHGPRPAADVLAAVRDTLRRFVDACIPVFMVPGNHDAMTLKLNPYDDLAR
ncbi:MAG TPA: metallophosphoesterase [Longimicrobiales bacterium]|nr:metallophosphoesterase [Longimicrobiales bacterium]